jgi:hypothetical protein
MMSELPLGEGEMADNFSPAGNGDAEGWPEYRKLILSALQKLEESQSRTAERLAQGYQETMQKIAEYQRETADKLNETQRLMNERMSDRATEGRHVQEGTDQRMGRIDVRLAVLKVQMAAWGAAMGIVGGAVATAVAHMLIH